VLVQMFLTGPTLPNLFSMLMVPSSDDDFEEDSDDEVDEENTTGDRLFTRGSRRRRRRRNRRRSGLPRHGVPWSSAEPRGLFPRHALKLRHVIVG